MKKPLLVVALLATLPLSALSQAVLSQDKALSRPQRRFATFEAIAKEVGLNGGAAVARETHNDYPRRFSNAIALRDAGASENHFNPETAVHTKMSAELLALIAAQNARLIQQNDEMIKLMKKGRR